MKRFLSFLCFGIILCMLAFAGCSDNDWTEVQSITYSVNGETATYTSQICYYGTSEEIDQATYESAPKEQKKAVLYDIPIRYPKYESISINRKENISEAKERSGKTIFCVYLNIFGEPLKYMKETISEYKIQYVTVKFTDNGNLEIGYYNGQAHQTVRVLPTSYEITYFED